MKKVSELTGALLDYWSGRAAGLCVGLIAGNCVRYPPVDPIIGPDLVRFEPSTNWAQGGPLIEKYNLSVVGDGDWHAGVAYHHEFCAGDGSEGNTPLQAICRAVVRAAFGDEVEEVVRCL